MNPPGDEYIPGLFLRNVPFRLSEEALGQMFSRYGDVIDVYIKKGLEPLTYAFVYFHSVDLAREAFSRINQKHLPGISVELGVKQDNSERKPRVRNNNQAPGNNAPYRDRGRDRANPADSGGTCTNTEHVASWLDYKSMTKNLRVSYSSTGRQVCEPYVELAADTPHVVSPGEHSKNFRGSYNNQINSYPPSRVASGHYNTARVKVSEMNDPVFVSHSSKVQIYEMNGTGLLPTPERNSHNGSYDNHQSLVPSDYNSAVVPYTGENKPVVPACGHLVNNQCCSHVHNHCAASNHCSSPCVASCHHNLPPCSAMSAHNACSMVKNPVQVFTPDPDVPPLRSTVNLCSYCNRELGKFACTICEQLYCSESCQLKDWPNHKKSCRTKTVLNTNNDMSKCPKQVEPGQSIVKHKEPEHNGVQQNSISGQKDLNSQHHNKCGESENPQRTQMFNGYNRESDKSEKSNHSVQGSYSGENQKFQKSMSYQGKDGSNSYSAVGHKPAENHRSYPTKTPPKLHPQPTVENMTNQRTETPPSHFHQSPTKRVNYNPRSSDVKKQDSWEGAGNGPVTENHRSYPAKTPPKMNPQPTFENMTNQRNETLPTQFRQAPKKKVDYNPRSSDIKKQDSWEGAGDGPGNKFSVKETVHPLPNIQEKANSNILIAAKIKKSAMKSVTLEGSAEKVTVCYMKSMGEIYLQRLQDTQVLNQIGLEMMALSKSKTVFSSPVVDDVCGGLFSDGCYYRAQVNQVAEDSCLVYFIDYGNSYLIKNSDLCYLTSNLGNYPALAIKCELADVKPKNDCKDWSKESLEYFANLVEGKVLTARVLKTSGLFYSVELITEKGISLASILASENHAELISPRAPERSAAESAKAPERPSVVPIDHTNVKPSLTKVPQPEISKPSGRPSQDRHQNIARQDSMEIEIPTALEMFDVPSTHIVVVVYTSEKVIWGWPKNATILELFETMNLQLQEACENMQDVSMIMEEGDIAAACSPTDSMWYRCSIVKRQKDSFCVRYIDFGNEEAVTKLRRLSDEHKKVRSPLLGLKIVNEQHFNKFAEFKENGVFTVTVQSKNENSAKMNAIASDQTTVEFLAFPWSYDIVAPLETSLVDVPPSVFEKPQVVAAPPPAVEKPQVVAPPPAVEKPRVVAPPPAVEKPQVVEPPPAMEKPQVISQSNSVLSSDAEKLDIARRILKPRELKNRIKSQVSVSWIVSMQEIYVQKRCDATELAELDLDINMYCNSGERQAYRPIEGEIVCARFVNDNKWYRSHILKVLPNDKFDALFIDYGNKMEISLQDIEKLDQQFSLKPVYSICVSLHKPHRSISLEQLHELYIKPSLELLVVNSQGPVQQVVFYDNGRCIFTDENAPAKNTSPYSGFRPSSNGRNPTVGFPTKKKNVLEIRVADFDGETVQIEFIDIQKNFYVTLLSQHDFLRSMQMEIADYCQKHSMAPYIPEVDHVVCVQWSTLWHRGTITEVRDDVCMVQLIDHGPTVEIIILNVRPLPPKFFHPVFLLPVTLDSVNKDKLTEEACKGLKRCTYKLTLLEKTKPPIKCKMFLGDGCINDNFMDSNPLVSTLQKRVLSINEVLDVTWWFIKEDLYFLHLESDDVIINTMNGHLQDECQTSLPIKELPRVNELVFAKSEDHLWYRACVEKVISAKNKCIVLFIDYGNSECVSKEDMRTFSAEFQHHPIFAIGVEVVNQMGHPIQLTKTYSVKTSGSVDKPVVTVLPTEESHSASHPSGQVSEIMALSTPSEPCAATPAVATEPPPADSAKFLFDTIDHVEFPEGDVTIVIYNAENYDLVYCTPFTEENLTVNGELVEKITAYCNSQDNIPYKPLELNEMVLAKYNDANWYRAAVIHMTDTTAQLIFVDYGGSLDVGYDDIRKMTAEFFAVPIQAHICTLAGFVPEEAALENVKIEVTQLPTFAPVAAKVTRDANNTILVEIPSFTEKLRALGYLKN